ncbi:hypothetical protein [Chryseobacterium wanjuense]
MSGAAHRFGVKTAKFIFFIPDGKRERNGGWINGSEICRAEANTPFDKFEHKQVILAPRGEGFWDATTCHNPLIKKVGNQYLLFSWEIPMGKQIPKELD